MFLNLVRFNDLYLNELPDYDDYLKYLKPFVVFYIHLVHKQLPNHPE